MSDITARAPIVTFSYIQWGPVIAGAVAAAALAAVLHSFAAAIGLSVSSTSPTWRDASFALFLLSGFYLLIVALASYSFGGYIAGFLCERTAVPADPADTELRDHLHGLLVWALATLLSLMLVFAAATATTRLTAPSGGSGPSSSVAGESPIAFDVDRLLRSDRRPAEAAADVSSTRAEVSRILLTASGHSGVAPEDRDYLIRLVGLRTGLAAPDAGRRVDTAITSAKNNLSRARRSATILAFMAGASALLGAVAAWFAAGAGGQHRRDATGYRMSVLGRRQQSGAEYGKSGAN